MTSLLTAVYRALLPLPCALSRAWPHQAQPLPAISFSLADYKVGEGGPDSVTIRLSVRAALPEEADALADQAVAALVPLGLRLASARDEAEADTGVFLKGLAFSGLALEGGLLALGLEVKSGTAWVQAAGLHQAGFDPAERRFRDIRTLSETASRYIPDGETPAALRLRFRPGSGDPGQAAIRQAFDAGEALSWRLSGGACSSLGRGLVTECSDNALGLACRVMIIE
mgnify:CR=1 FL=1